MPEPLAIDGGRPVRTEPMPPWPQFGPETIEAVDAVLRSGRINYWTGTEGRDFEREYAQATGRAHAIAVANGTLALELALRAFGIGPGDEVVVPSRTFVATASAAVAVGARPVVCDIDPDSGNMTAESFEAAITPATRAVIPVHLGGWPADVAGIAEVARERDIVVIEDCAQAHGGAVGDLPVGNLGSHAAAFSFCQDKILPTGEGGMLVLDDAEAHARAWAYKDHGKSLAKLEDPAFMADPEPFKYLVDEFGSNWRLHELAAAIGRVGLAHLPEWHARRTSNAMRLAHALDGVAGIRVPLPAAGVTHAFYRLYAQIDTDALAEGWTRNRVLEAVAAEGVPVQYGSSAEIYREPAFAAADASPSAPLPGASFADEHSIAFFVHPTLGDAEMDATAEAVVKVLGTAVAR